MTPRHRYPDEPDRHDVDWDRYLVDAVTKGSPLGDPTRWGAALKLSVLPSTTVQTIVSEQIIQAACLDRYARQWTVVGTVSADKIFWDSLTGTADPGPGSIVTQWYSLLRIRMGVGQNTLVHTVDLRAVCDAQEPFYWIHGDNTVDPSGPILTKPFVLDSAIVANNVAISYLTRSDYSVLPATPQVIQIAVQINPLAPGGHI